MTRSRLYFPISDGATYGLLLTLVIGIAIIGHICMDANQHGTEADHAKTLDAEIPENDIQRDYLAPTVSVAGFGSGFCDNEWLEHGPSSQILSEKNGGARGEKNSERSSATDSLLLPAANNQLPASTGACSPSGADGTSRPEMVISRILDAIRQVEGAGVGVIGDSGRSRGPYQISHAYWVDSGIALPYLMNVNNPAICRQVIVRYWSRYCPQALERLDIRKLAAVHNRGPHGNPNSDYARRVAALTGRE